MLALAAAVVLGTAGFLCLLWAALYSMLAYLLWFADVKANWREPLLAALGGAVLLAAAFYVIGA